MGKFQMSTHSNERSLGRVLALVMILATPGSRAANPSLTDLPDQEFQPRAEKTNLYVKALNAPRNVQRSYDRYASWIEMKKDPTGTERYISKEGISWIS
jgi:hypothetical protein